MEHTLNYKKNLKLIKYSAYTITVRNSMRLNNEISPIRNLENVLDLGLLIQSARIKWQKEKRKRSRCQKSIENSIMDFGCFLF